MLKEYCLLHCSEIDNVMLNWSLLAAPRTGLFRTEIAKTSWNRTKGMRLKDLGVWNSPSLQPSTPPSTHHLLFICVFHICEEHTFSPHSLNAGQGEEGLRFAQWPRAAQAPLPLCLLESHVD